jgi:hypothetical protein
MLSLNFETDDRKQAEEAFIWWLKLQIKTNSTFPCETRKWSDNKVRELNAVKVLHTSFLETTVVAFKVLPLGSYALMPAPSPLFKTIL